MPKITQQSPKGNSAPAISTRPTTPTSPFDDEALPEGQVGDGWGDAEGLRVVVYGQSGCLSGDTFISYQIRDGSGKMQNHKGGSMELLYRRFHGLPRSGKGYYQRPQTVGSSYYVASITDEGRVTRNLVTDVIDSGDRPVFEIVTRSGMSIKATANHEFMTESGYVPLADLRPGDEVLVSPGRRLKTERARRISRPGIMVKNHPAGRIKMVDKYRYYRLPRTHLVYEAAQNGMSPEEYREALNTLPMDDVEKFWTVPFGAEIHHLDEDPLNDVEGNLVLVESSSGHQGTYHSEAIYRPGMSIYVVVDEVESITRLGTERVYDISVADPYRNFIAGGSDGFAVHNSGKTTFASTFPGPILWLIISGSGRPGELKSIATPENKRKIRPVIIRSQQHFSEEIEASAGKYAGVVVDHATGFADMVIKELLGLKKVPLSKYRTAGKGESWSLVSMQQYGQLAVICKETFRNLLELPGNIVFIAQERSFGGKEEGVDPEVIRPTVGPALTPGIAGWLMPACDYVVQTYKRPRLREVETTLPDGERVTQLERVPGTDYCLRTGPHDVYITKFRIPKGLELPEAIVDPSYDKMLALINGG